MSSTVNIFKNFRNQKFAFKIDNVTPQTSTY